MIHNESLSSRSRNNPSIPYVLESGRNDHQFFLATSQHRGEHIPEKQHVKCPSRTAPISTPYRIIL